MYCFTSLLQKLLVCHSWYFLPASRTRLPICHLTSQNVSFSRYQFTCPVRGLQPSQNTKYKGPAYIQTHAISKSLLFINSVINMAHLLCRRSKFSLLQLSLYLRLKQEGRTSRIPYRDVWIKYTCTYDTRKFVCKSQRILYFSSKDNTFAQWKILIKVISAIAEYFYAYKPVQRNRDITLIDVGIRALLSRLTRFMLL